MFVSGAERSALVQEGDPGPPPGGGPAGGGVGRPEDQLLVGHQERKVVVTMLHRQGIYSGSKYLSSNVESELGIMLLDRIISGSLYHQISRYFWYSLTIARS